MKKRLVSIFIMICVLVTVLPAADSVAIDLEDFNIEEQVAFMFLYGYEAILEELCKGCFLALGPDMEYIGGWRTSITPDDFAVNIPPETITTFQTLPTGLARVMFQLLQDNETVAKLTNYSSDGVYVVCMFLPVKGMVLSDPNYNYGQRLLETEIVRHGIEPSEFYVFMETQTDSETGKPITLDSMLATMYRKEATAKEIVLDGLGRMEAQKVRSTFLSRYSRPLLTIVVALGTLVALMAIIFGLYSASVSTRLRKADRQAEIDKHNDEVDA